MCIYAELYIYIQVDLNLPLLVANNVGPQVFEESGSLPDLVQILSRSRLKRNPVLALQTSRPLKCNLNTASSWHIA